MFWWSFNINLSWRIKWGSIDLVIWFKLILYYSYTLRNDKIKIIKKYDGEGGSDNDDGDGSESIRTINNSIDKYR